MLKMMARVIVALAIHALVGMGVFPVVSIHVVSLSIYTWS